MVWQRVLSYAAQSVTRPLGTITATVREVAAISNVATNISQVGIRSFGGGD